MKKTINSIISLCILLLCNCSFCDAENKEKNPPKPSTDIVDFGIGIGLDYGGMGCQILGYPQKNIGILLGFGYNGLALGYNVGLKSRLLFRKSNPTISPFVLGMYGYNAGVDVKGPTYYTNIQKQFNGYTIGLGLDIRIKPMKFGYFSIAILRPFPSQEYEDYVSGLKNNSRVKLDKEPSIYKVSIGYKFVLNRSSTR